MLGRRPVAMGHERSAPRAAAIRRAREVQVVGVGPEAVADKPGDGNSCLARTGQDREVRPAHEPVLAARDGRGRLPAARAEAGDAERRARGAARLEPARDDRAVVRAGQVRRAGPASAEGRQSFQRPAGKAIMAAARIDRHRWSRVPCSRDRARGLARRGHHRADRLDRLGALPVELSADDPARLPERIDEDGRRIGEHAPVAHGGAVRIEENRQVESESFEKGGEDGRLLAGIHREKRERLVGKTGFKSRHRGHLAHAGCAPGGPEVHEHHLAPVVGEGMRFATRIAEGERGEGGAVVRHEPPGRLRDGGGQERQREGQRARQRPWPGALARSRPRGGVDELRPCALHGVHLRRGERKVRSRA